MYARKQYLMGECTHREYYGQFVTPNHVQTVVRFIGEDVLRRSKDEHFNDIPLKMWDMIKAPAGTIEKMKEAGDFLSQAGAVCICKEAAFQWLEHMSKYSELHT